MHADNYNSGAAEHTLYQCGACRVHLMSDTICSGTTAGVAC